MFLCFDHFIQRLDFLLGDLSSRIFFAAHIYVCTSRVHWVGSVDLVFPDVMELNANWNAKKD